VAKRVVKILEVGANHPNPGELQPPVTKRRKKASTYKGDSGQDKPLMTRVGSRWNREQPFRNKGLKQGRKGKNRPAAVGRDYWTKERSPETITRNMGGGASVDGPKKLRSVGGKPPPSKGEVPSQNRIRHSTTREHGRKRCTFTRADMTPAAGNGKWEKTTIGENYHQAQKTAI